MSKTLEFKVFCFEAYRTEKNMTGRETMQLFKKYGVLDYLGACYNVLHTTGRAYIVEDIDIFIEARKKLTDKRKYGYNYSCFLIFIYLQKKHKL